jgi:hypothetical protein
MGREENLAPEGQNKLAQGFSPGCGVLKRHALKAALESVRHVESADPKPRANKIWRHFQGASNHNPIPRVKTLG